MALQAIDHSMLKTEFRCPKSVCQASIVLADGSIVELERYSLTSCHTAEFAFVLVFLVGKMMNEQHIEIDLLQVAC